MVFISWTLLGTAINQKGQQDRKSVRSNINGGNELLVIETLSESAAPHEGSGTLEW